MKVKITGKVIDLKYAYKLAQIPNLSLNEIMLLDKVQKQSELTEEEIKHLRKNNLIEGRKPNIYISSKIAKETHQKSHYVKLRGIEDEYSIKIITDYLKKFKTAKRADLFDLLSNKLSDALTEDQKQHKLKNLLQKMKHENIINLNENRQWHLTSSKNAKKK